MAEYKLEMLTSFFASTCASTMSVNTGGVFLNHGIYLVTHLSFSTIFGKYIYFLHIRTLIQYTLANIPTNLSVAVFMPFCLNIWSAVIGDNVLVDF